MSDKLQDTIDWVRSRHEHWYDHLADWCQAARLGHLLPEPPACEVLLRPSKTAGFYKKKTHTCHYNLAYAILFRDTYDAVIAHEICHSFQLSLLGSRRQRWHGDLFFFLLHTVCGLSGEQTYHKYDVKKAKQLGELLSLAASTSKRQEKQ